MEGTEAASVTARRRFPTVPALGLVGLVAMAWAARSSLSWQWALPNWSLTLPHLALPSMVASQNNGSSQTDQVNSNPPLWLHQLLIALALLAGLILAIAIIRLIVKALRGLAIAHIDPLPAGTTWPVGQARTLAPAQVDQAIDQAITRLQEAASPSDAIIGAWLALEEAASRHGVVRQVWQTPTEFTRTVFRLGDRVGQPLDNLRRLYARARFSDQPSSSADVDAAQQALTEIRRSWSSQTGQS